MQASRTSEQPPVRKGAIPFLRHYLEFRSKPLQFWIECAKTAPIFRIHFGMNREYWVISDADAAQYILQQRARYFPREQRLTKSNRKGEAPTVFNTDSWDDWLWRRRMLQPAFHRTRIAKFAEAMVAETLFMSRHWQDGEILNFQHMMKTLTMRIIGRTMFSAEVDKTDILQEAYEQTTLDTFKRSSELFSLPRWIPTDHNKKTQQALNAQRKTLGNIVKSRYEENNSEGDLLDMLIAATLEDSERQFTADELVSEMSSIVFAGHDTTALTLTWLFYEVAKNPEIEDKMRDEIESAIGNRMPTVDDLDNMPYIEQVINETLRMYPPVYITLREAAEDDTLGGYPIKAGTSVALNIRGIHQSNKYWDNAETFEPERFAPENEYYNNAFIPFIIGPRKCIGDSFATMEMRLIVPTLMQQFQFVDANPSPPIPTASMTMETDQDIRLKVQKL